MPSAIVIALLEQFGPVLLQLLLRHGPDLWRLILASEANGTLQRDVEALIRLAQTGGALMAGLSSLADVAPVEFGNPQAGQRDQPLGSKAR